MPDERPDKRAMLVASFLPGCCLVALFALLWLRENDGHIPADLAFVAPLVHALDDETWVRRVSRAARYESFGTRAATIKTTSGYVSVIEFATWQGPRAFIRSWQYAAVPPRFVLNGNTIIFTDSARLEAAIRRFVARRAESPRRDGARVGRWRRESAPGN